MQLKSAHTDRAGSGSACLAAARAVTKSGTNTMPPRMVILVLMAAGAIAGPAPLRLYPHRDNPLSSPVQHRHFVKAPSIFGDTGRGRGLPFLPAPITSHDLQSHRGAGL